MYDSRFGPLHYFSAASYRFIERDVTDPETGKTVRVQRLVGKDEDWCPACKGDGCDLCYHVGHGPKERFET